VFVQPVLLESTVTLQVLQDVLHVWRALTIHPQALLRLTHALIAQSTPTVQLTHLFRVQHVQVVKLVLRDLLLVLLVVEMIQ
jgi:hypothetical protein